jgi:hypothetical protein
MFPLFLATHPLEDANPVKYCVRICDQATLGIAEKRPIQIGFESWQAAQVVDLN